MSAPRTTFNHATTADEVLEGIDLTGKTALITGASSGLGAETARALASKGAKVIITARKAEKAAEVAASIRASYGADKVDVEELELGSQSNIRAFADRILKSYDKLDILINNAGIMACPYAETADGIESQFGTNHIGHFLMTCLIAPTLIKGAPSRIVSLSSRGHTISPVVFEDIQFKNREYEKWSAYGQSKTANALFAVELDRRLKGKGVRAFSVHPGAIQTGLSRHMGDAELEAMNQRMKEGPMAHHMKSVPAGAATSVYAATAPELEGKGGDYLEDCNIAEVRESMKDQADGVLPHAVDPEAARKLWDVSEEIVGQKFDF